MGERESLSASLRRAWHRLPPMRQIDARREWMREREERHARWDREAEERKNRLLVNDCGHVGISSVFVCAECGKPFSGYCYEIDRAQYPTFRAEREAQS